MARTPRRFFASMGGRCRGGFAPVGGAGTRYADGASVSVRCLCRCQLEAAAPVLDSPDFYADCRALLSEDGCMTVNLFGRSSSFERSLQSMATAFGEEALWAFKPTREGNTVVLAQRTPSRPKRAELMARAEVVQERWGLPATKWLRVFKPVVA